MAPMLRRRPKRPLENLLSNWIRFVDVSPRLPQIVIFLSVYVYDSAIVAPTSSSSSRLGHHPSTDSRYWNSGSFLHLTASRVSTLLSFTSTSYYLGPSNPSLSGPSVSRQVRKTLALAQPPSDQTPPEIDSFNTKAQ